MSKIKPTLERKSRSDTHMETGSIKLKSTRILHFDDISYKVTIKHSQSMRKNIDSEDVRIDPVEVHLKSETDLVELEEEDIKCETDPVEPDKVDENLKENVIFDPLETPRLETRPNDGKLIISSPLIPAVGTNIPKQLSFNEPISPFCRFSGSLLSPRNKLSAIPSLFSALGNLEVQIVNYCLCSERTNSAIKPHAISGVCYHLSMYNERHNHALVQYGHHLITNIFLLFFFVS